MLTDPTATVPAHKSRGAHRFRNLWRVLLLAPVMLAACGGGTSDEPFANGVRGGGERDGNYSPAALPAISSFTEILFDSLDAGFLGSPLPISGNVAAAVAGKGQLVFIRHEQLARVYRFGPDEYPLPELACDSAARVYAVTTGRLLCAVDTAGNLLWKREIMKGAGEFDLPTWPLVVPGGVVAGTTGGTLKRFDFGGRETWSLQAGAQLVRSVPFSPELGIALGITRNDYAGSDTLLLLDEAGKEKWRAPLQGLRIEYGPIITGGHVVIGASGKDAAGKYTPVVLAFGPAGKELWRTPLKVLPLGIAGDDEGNLYVSGGGGSGLAGGIISSFGPDGTLRWEIRLPESVPSMPVTAGDRFCFVALRDQTLGLYSYNSAGQLIGFAPISSLTDIVPVPVLLPYGSVLLAGVDEPVLLRSR